MDVSNRWYLLFCKPNMEERAQENLERQGYITYLPRCIEPKRRAGKWRNKICPLFSRYLFIQLSTNDNWAPIRSTRGVSGMVRFGYEYAPIPEIIVAQIRKREDSSGVINLNDAPIFESGAKVKIAEGAMQGLDAIFLAPTSDQRAYVLLNILGKESKVVMKMDWLELAQ